MFSAKNEMEERGGYQKRVVEVENGKVIFLKCGRIIRHCREFIN